MREAAPDPLFIACRNVRDADVGRAAALVPPDRPSAAVGRSQERPVSSRFSFQGPKGRRTDRWRRNDTRTLLTCSVRHVKWHPMLGQRFWKKPAGREQLQHKNPAIEISPGHGGSFQRGRGCDPAPDMFALRRGVLCSNSPSLSKPAPYAGQAHEGGQHRHRREHSAGTHLVARVTERVGAKQKRGVAVGEDSYV